MKPSQRKRIIKGLKQAKEVVKSREVVGICAAINRQSKYYCLHDRYPILKMKDVDYLEDWINNMLGGSIWLEHWMTYNNIPVPNYNGMVQIRCDWLDWMIEEIRRD